LVAGAVDPFNIRNTGPRRCGADGTNAQQAARTALSEVEAFPKECVRRSAPRFRSSVAYFVGAANDGGQADGPREADPCRAAGSCA
jgi:hypothetical protein